MSHPAPMFVAYNCPPALPGQQPAHISKIQTNGKFNFMATENHGIKFAVIGRAGVITLDRPESLNAVTDVMVREISHHLDAWENDVAVERIIIKATGERAFSAGGDIRHLYDCGIAGNYDFGFFAAEYALNARIYAFPKPYIALINGIVMGGGVGVSFHGSHRIAGKNIAFAMPEVGIGFFPDVGGSYLLSRLPGKLGLYLGLTGERMKQADCVASGLATHACDDLEALETALCESADLQSVLSSHCHSCNAGPQMQNLGSIDDAFSGGDVLDVVSRLESMESGSAGEWAGKTRASILSKSPTSLEVAFRQISRGAGLTLSECMKMEFRILMRLLPGKEFYEGIRAVIIDKDGAPVWSPASLAQVDTEEIEKHFASLGDKELKL